MSTLRAEGVSVSYGGVKALTEVDLKIGPGQLVGLIGPNGAGKTTFVDAITGFVPCSGQVWLGDQDISSLRPHDRAKAGLTRTFQSGELFVDLTARENVAVPAPRSVGSLVRELLTGRPAGDEIADQVLDELGIGHLTHAMPGSLTQGQRKLVGVARALARKPQLVCLDEPAAGLDTGESREFGEKLRKLADAGQSILLVDHDMGLVMSVCDELVVLDFGQVIATGDPAAIRKDARVRSAYLGTDAGQPSSPPPADGGVATRLLAPVPTRGGISSVGVREPEDDLVSRMSAATDSAPILRVEGLVTGYNGSAVVRNVDLTVSPGEVVALLGPNGAGKTTVLRAISRLIDCMDGRVMFDDADIADVAPHTLARRGLVHLPEDKGIFAGLTVAEHFRSAPGGPLDAAAGFEHFPALRPLRDRRVGLLSGGEQQMLAVAIALARQPKLLVLDELSHGLAPVIVQHLLPVVCSYAAETNAGVLLVEQHVPLALQVSDRAHVLAHGELILSGTGAELRQDERLLMASYLGERSATTATVTASRSVSG